MSDQGSAKRVLPEPGCALERLVANLPGIAYRCSNDPDWTMEFVSDGCLALTGRPAEALVGGAFGQLIHPDDQPTVWHAIQAGIRRDDTFRVGYRLIDVSGRQRWVWDQGRAIRSPTGAVLAIEGFIADVTERVEAERRAQRLARMHRVLSSLNEAIVRIRDPQELYRETCRIVVDEGLFRMAWIGLVDPSTLKVVPAAWWGQEDGYIQGLHITVTDAPRGQGPTGRAIQRGERAIIHDVAADPAMAPWREPALARGYRCAAAFPLRMGDRVVGALTLYAADPDAIDEEDIRLLERMCADLSRAMEALGEGRRRKELEAALTQAQKMEAIGRLAGGVAHDFNNLLMVITSYATFIADGLGPDHALRGDAEQIRVAADRGASLTRQLLAFSRKQVLQPRILDLGDVVRRTETFLQRIVGEDVELVTHIEPAGRVRADPTQLEQVIMNLVVNARDAMPNGGRLTITVRDLQVHPAELLAPSSGHGDFVVLEVADTGVGLDLDAKARLFEPFFTTKPQGQGTGLGLPMVYGIVQQSGGFIRVDGAPGQGSRFSVHLPRMLEPVTVDPEPRPRPPPVDTAGLHCETLLLVEDEEPVRELVRRVLSDQGYQVLEAADGVAALEIARSHPGPIHVLVSDLIMPRMGGRELASTLRESHPELRVIFVSGYATDALSGADFDAALLQKPFTLEGLTRTVRAVLEE